MEKQQRQQVEKNMREAREKLESEMEDAYHEHQANLLRQGKCSGGVVRLKKKMKVRLHLSENIFCLMSPEKLSQYTRTVVKCTCTKIS